MELSLKSVDEGSISFICPFTRHSLSTYSLLRPELGEIWIRGRSQTVWFKTLRALGLELDVFNYSLSQLSIC